jgi:hypothetical protein
VGVGVMEKTADLRELTRNKLGKTLDKVNEKQVSCPANPRVAMMMLRVHVRCFGMERPLCLLKEHLQSQVFVNVSGKNVSGTIEMFNLSFLYSVKG